MSTSGFASTMKHPFDTEAKFSCRLMPNLMGRDRANLRLSAASCHCGLQEQLWTRLPRR
jgi:hypothetical protein